MPKKRLNEKLTQYNIRVHPSMKKRLRDENINVSRLFRQFAEKWLAGDNGILPELNWVFDPVEKYHFSEGKGRVYLIRPPALGEYKLEKESFGQRITLGWFKKLESAMHVARLIEKG